MYVTIPRVYILGLSLSNVWLSTSARKWHWQEGLQPSMRVAASMLKARRQWRPCDVHGSMLQVRKEARREGLFLEYIWIYTWNAFLDILDID